MLLIPALLAGLLAVLARASLLTPPVIPLIVRNPYLSTWLQNARDVPWSTWPIFWTGQQVCATTTPATLVTSKANLPCRLACRCLPLYPTPTMCTRC